jgi:lipoprotein-anchoring transpeptidase ErfK/SrfK
MSGMRTGGWRGRLLAVALLVAGVTVGAVAVQAASDGPTAAPAPAQAAVAVPAAFASSTGADGAQPWSAPLVVGAHDGELLDVVALGPDDAPLAGAVTAGTWTSTGQLLPSTVYRVSVTVRDAAGQERTRPLVVRTAAAERVLTAALSPGDDAVVGVGMPVTVRLDGPVSDPAAREALAARLSVESEPSVRGAWRWMNDAELHWRPAEFWPAGTQVSVRADLERLPLPDGTWGSGVRTSQFRIGEAVVSTVDVAAHTMTVTRGGEVLRVLKASMGKPEHPTRGGTHLVLEKDATRVMDSDTVGLPGEYRTKVDWAVRLTYSGTFTHSAPWSVAQQGVANVSHGCINLSPDDAKWFYDLARRGDVVQVVGTDVPPKLDDPGAADWNLTFDQWRAT